MKPVTITLTHEQAVFLGIVAYDASRKSRRLAANAEASRDRCDECGKYSGFAQCRLDMHRRNERLARELHDIVSSANHST